MLAVVTARCAVFVLQIYGRWCAELRKNTSVSRVFHE